MVGWQQRKAGRSRSGRRHAILTRSWQGSAVSVGGAWWARRVESVDVVLCVVSVDVVLCVESVDVEPYVESVDVVLSVESVMSVGGV